MGAKLTAKEFHHLKGVARLCALSRMNGPLWDWLENMLVKTKANKRTRRLAKVLCGHGSELKGDQLLLQPIRASVRDHAVTFRGET